MTLYLGIPDKEWDLLLSEAEELLVETEIGTHLLGVYPCGDRIFGDESGAPSLLCLYLDDPARLLNPCSTVKPIVSLGIGRGCGPATFISLHSWAQKVCAVNRTDIKFDTSLYNLIPPMSAPLYEDPQLTVLMDLARDFLGASQWREPVVCKGAWRDNYAAYLRALIILYHTGTFAPCLNKSWHENVVPLDNGWLHEPEITQQEDTTLVSLMSGEIPPIPEEDWCMLESILEEDLHKVYIEKRKPLAMEERDAFGEAVGNLYRRLL